MQRTATILLVQLATDGRKVVAAVAHPTQHRQRLQRRDILGPDLQRCHYALAGDAQIAQPLRNDGAPTLEGAALARLTLAIGLG